MTTVDTRAPDVRLGDGQARLIAEAPPQPATVVRRPSRRAGRSWLVLLSAAVVLVAGTLAAAATAGPAAQRGIVEGVAVALRAVTYTGVLAAVGGAVFLAAVHDGQDGERVRLLRFIVVAATAAVVAGLLAVPVQSALVAGTGLVGLGDARTVTAVLSSPFGTAALVRTIGLAGLLAGLPRVRSVSGRAVTAAGGTLVLGAFLLTGHAATGGPRLLVAGTTLVHTATAGVWLGGLLGLALVLCTRRRTGDTVGGARIVGRFSVVAGTSLAALIPTGTLLGVRQMGGVAGLVTSGYGRALLVKVVLVAAVVAVGAYNRWHLVPAITRNSPGAWQRLSATVRWEAAGLILVVVATGFLGRLTPPA